MNSMKNIIINADDYGLTDEVNRGILEGLRCSAISSVSVLSVGEAFEEGIRELAAFESAGKGIHLCLTDEMPIRPAAEIPTITTREGRFCSLKTLAALTLLGRVSSREVYLEWKGQIERFLAAGFTPTHIDTHNHVHLFPKYFSILLHLAEEYGIPSIRGIPNSGIERPFALRNLVKWLLAAAATRRYKGLKERKILFPDQVYGFYRSGVLTEEDLHRYVESTPSGTFVEVISHPGHGSSAMNKRYRAWNYDWEHELSVLKKVVGGQEMACRGGRIVSYREMNGSRGSQTPPPSRHPDSLSVILPAFNEFENIQKTLASIKRFLKNSPIRDYEIIVVDDGSTDGTAAAAAALLKNGEGRVIGKQRREGYGAALKTGIEAAGKEWLFYCDADYPAHIEHLNDAFACIDSADIVTGCRENGGNDGIERSFYRKGYRYFITTLFGLPVSDVNFAFKLIRRSILSEVKLTTKSSFIDAELLIEAYTKGYRIKEISMPFLPRTFGKSSLNTLGNILDTTRNMVMYYYRWQQALSGSVKGERCARG